MNKTKQLTKEQEKALRRDYGYIKKYVHLTPNLTLATSSTLGRAVEEQSLRRMAHIMFEAPDKIRLILPILRGEVAKQIAAKEKTFNYEEARKNILSLLLTKRHFRAHILWRIHFSDQIGFPFKNMAINGVKFRLISKKGISKRVSGKLFEDEFISADIMQHGETNMYVLSASIEAYNDREAADIIWEAIEDFRSIWNYSLLTGTITYRFGNNTPLNRILPPRFMAITEVNLDKSNIYSAVSYNYSHLARAKVNKEMRSKRYYRLLKKLIQGRTRSKYTARLLLDCLRIYQNAFDQEHRSLTYQYLWLVCEAGTGKNKNLNQLERIKLIAGFFHLPEERAVAKDLRDIRNELIHTGKYFEEDLDNQVNWMKKYADAMIDILRWVVGKGIYNKSYYEEFLNLYTKFGQGKLDLHGKMVRQLQNATRTH